MATATKKTAAKTAANTTTASRAPAAVSVEMPKAQAGKYKFPKALAACADRYYELREQRLALQKNVDAVEAEEKAIKEHLIQSLPKSEASGVAGKLCRVSAVTKEVPQVQDWDKFYAHVKKTGSFELLQRRVNDGAVRERWDNGKDVPGVGHFTAVTLSVNKL